jgi:hypothetical protein
MGLESVELVMAVEQAFAVRFEHVQLRDLVTVGSLWHQIEIRLPASAEDSHEPAWERYRLLVAKELGVPLERVTAQARFVDLGLG